MAVVGLLPCSHATTLQRPYQLYQPLANGPRERTTTDFYDSLSSKATTFTLVASMGAECACCLRQSWSIAGKPDWRMLGPEPLNSCSGNSWVGCRPPLHPHRLLSALDILWKQPEYPSPPLAPESHRRVFCASRLICCEPAVLAPTFPPFGRRHSLSPPGLSPSFSVALLIKKIENKKKTTYQKK